MLFFDIPTRDSMEKNRAFENKKNNHLFSKVLYV